MECFWPDRSPGSALELCKLLPFKGFKSIYLFHVFIAERQGLFLLRQTEYAVSSGGVLGGAEKSQIKDVGQTSKYLPDKSVTGIDCTGL